jgi:hypothetical protein
MIGLKNAFLFKFVAKSFQEEHLPWGLPEGGVGVEGCLLTQPFFITGYSTYLRIPLWTANKINGTVRHVSSALSIYCGLC